MTVEKPKHDRTISETTFGETYFLEDGIIGERAIISLGIEGVGGIHINREDIVAMLLKMDGK